MFPLKQPQTEQMRLQFSLLQNENNDLRKKIDELLKKKALMHAESEKTKIQDVFVANYQNLIYE